MCVSTVLFFSLSNVVFAGNSTPAFTLKTINSETLTYKVGPGSTIKDSVVVYNLDPTRDIKIKLSTSLPEKWIHFSESISSIPAGSSKVIGFTINIPKNSNIENKQEILQSNLVSYDESSTSSGALQIGIGVGLRLILDIADQPATTLDLTTNKNDAKNITNIDTKSFKVITNKIYNYIQNNLEFVFLLIIMALFLKLALNKKEKSTTVKKSNKTKIKSTTDNKTSTLKKKVSTTKKPSTTKKKDSTIKKTSTAKKKDSTTKKINTKKDNTSKKTKKSLTKKPSTAKTKASTTTKKATNKKKTNTTKKK